jgi:hypothetical protein
MNDLFQEVVEILTPYLGPNTARASVKMFLTKVNLTPEQFRPRHIDKVLGKIEPGLRVFVGGAKASAVSKKIRALGDSGQEAP